MGVQGAEEGGRRERYGEREGGEEVTCAAAGRSFSAREVEDEPGREVEFLRDARYRFARFCEFPRSGARKVWTPSSLARYPRAELDVCFQD